MVLLQIELTVTSLIKPFQCDLDEIIKFEVESLTVIVGAIYKCSQCFLSQCTIAILNILINWPLCVKVN